MTLAEKLQPVVGKYVAIRFLGERSIIVNGLLNEVGDDDRSGGRS